MRVMTSADFHRAFDQIEDFLTVQGKKPVEEMLDAVECLQAAVGIEDEERQAIAERIETAAGFERTGQVMLGVLIGLLAADVEPAEQAWVPGD